MKLDYGLLGELSAEKTVTLPVGGVTLLMAALDSINQERHWQNVSDWNELDALISKLTLAIMTDIGSSVLSQYVRVQNHDIQTIASGVITAVWYSIDTNDTSGFFTSGSRLRVVSSTAGFYMVTGCVEWSASPGSNAMLGIRKNSTEYIAMSQVLNADYRKMEVAGMCFLSSAAYVELVVYQASGTSKTLLTTSFPPTFSMARVG
jgi:hypothetical protein